MDLRQLEMFKAVAEAGSFTAAGQQLRVAQSAISRKISLLEEELGTRVFRRTNKRVFMTPAGEALLRSSGRVFQELQHAVLEVSDLAGMKQGVLRIGSGLTACMYLLPPVIEKFKALYPNVKVQVVTGTTEAIIPQIRNCTLIL